MTWRNPSIRFWDSQIKQRKHYSSSQGCSQITWDHRCGRPSTEGSAAGSLPSCFPVFSNSFPFGLRTCPHPRPTLHQSHPSSALASLSPSFCPHPVPWLPFSSLCSWWGGSAPTDEGNYIHSTHLRQRSAWWQRAGWKKDVSREDGELHHCFALGSSAYEGLSVWQCRHVV